MTITLKAAAVDKKLALEFYRQMVLIRRFEERCAEWYGRGKIGGFLHLYIGEEAVAVGAMAKLAPQDYIVTHYREHGHAIARGLDTKKLMAELFGRSTGTSKGKGGSMHLFDASKGFLGGYAIVGGMMPVATGLALASKYKNEDRICLCIFGDGAVNEGEFHESFNLAALWKLPVIFLLENNGFGMGTRVERAHAGQSMHRLADAFSMPTDTVDGMDVLAVQKAMGRAVEYTRKGDGPFFLESITYRFRGHSMADPVAYRDKEEEDVWRQRDPINQLAIELRRGKQASQQELDAIAASVEDEVGEAIKFANESPEPSREEMFRDIVAD